MLCGRSIKSLGKAYGYACFPSPLSSIFSPKLRASKNGERISLDEVGARGGGFSLTKGSETWVRINSEEEDGVEVLVNGTIRDFPPSVEAAEEMRRRYGIRGRISIFHRIHLPIGVGFGTSASSAAGVIMAISRLTDNAITLREAIRLVHSIELRCRTGLNSEAGLMAGGLVLVLREGAPSRCLVDSIPVPQHIRLVSIVSGPVRTPDSMSDLSSLEEIERVGDRFLAKVLTRPSLENFLRCAKEFAYEAGFVSNDIEEMFEVLGRLPTVGYAQNMLGRAAHALVHRKDLKAILRELMESFPDKRVVLSDITSMFKVSHGLSGTQIAAMSMPN